MDPLDLLLWHYIPGALIAWLCFLIWRSIVWRWLNRNELRENQQMAEDIKAMREWQAIHNREQYYANRFFHLQKFARGTQREAEARKAWEEAEKTMKEEMVLWRWKWGRE